MIGDKWIMSVPVVSFLHISRDTMPWLEHMSGSEVWPIDGGYMVPVEAADLENIDKSLRELLTFFYEQGFDWVRLDSAGDTCDELNTYNWE